MSKKLGGHRSQWNSAQMNNRHGWQLKKKIKIQETVLELPPKQQCQSSPFTAKMGQRGRILNFSFAMGAKPSF